MRQLVLKGGSLLLKGERQKEKETLSVPSESANKTPSRVQ